MYCIWCFRGQAVCKTQPFHLQKWIFFHFSIQTYLRSGVPVSVRVEKRETCHHGTIISGLNFELLEEVSANWRRSPWHSLHEVVGACQVRARLLAPCRTRRCWARAEGLAPCLRLCTGFSRPGRRFPGATVSAPAQWFLQAGTQVSRGHRVCACALVSPGRDTGFLGSPCLRLRSGFSRPGRRFPGALSELPPGPCRPLALLWWCYSRLSSSWLILFIAESLYLLFSSPVSLTLCPLTQATSYILCN